MDDIFSLSESKTYNKKKDFSLSMVEEQFKRLIVEYFYFIIKNTKKMVMPTSGIYQYVVIRGLETMGHVYRVILLYTNNINAAIYHSQRSICLYVEFMLQILENSQTYLKLGSKDVMLYVYRETIFRLTSEHKKNCQQNISKRQVIEKKTYNIKETIDQTLYSVIDYIHDNVINSEITQQHIDKLEQKMLTGSNYTVF